MKYTYTQAEEGIYLLSGGKRTAPRNQMPADGLCGVCDKSVEAHSLNRFYCLHCQQHDCIRQWYREREDHR